MYRKYVKRIIDFWLSLVAIIVLSPVFVMLMVVGSVKMKGNPFFIQERPGQYEKVFKLIKFRTMTNELGPDGKLLSDAERLNAYGKILRLTSLDELPELFNILKGDMALVGPRPLLVRYLSAYTSVERRRHDVKPGLTGLAQVKGRNYIPWDDRLAYDVEYVTNLSFKLDIKIVMMTIVNVIKRKNVAINTDDIEEGYLDEIRGVKAE